MIGVARVALAKYVVGLLLVGFAVGDGSAQRMDFNLDTLRVRVGTRTWAALPAALRSVEVIDRARIEAAPAQTVADLLTWALGLDPQARSAAQADVGIRGSSFEQILVLVDGVRMSDAQTAHFDLDLAIPLDAIERIEVLRGPASAQYGSDAMGGVIHIVTRRGAPASARIEAGTHASVSGSAAAGVGAPGGTTGSFGLEYDRSDGTRSGTDYDMGLARASLGVPWAGGALRADAAYALRNFGAADFYTPVNVFDSYEETRTLTAALGWHASEDRRLAVEPRVSVRRHDDEFILRRDDPAFYRNVHENWQLGGELHARYAADSGSRFAVGGEAYRDLLDSNNLGERSATRVAAFGETAAGTTGRWLTQAGLRLDWHSEFGEFLAPSLAAAVWPADRLRVRGSIGRSFRAPSWTERFYVDPSNIGTADLEPERAWSAELGAQLSLPAARIDVAVWLRDADELIDWVKPKNAPTDTFRTMNIEKATFRGIDASIEWRGPFATAMSLSGTALTLDAPEASGLESKYVLNPLTETIVLSVDRAVLGGFGVGARARYARRVGEDPYVLADVRASYARQGWHAYLDVTNTTNAEYLDVSARTGAGRQLRVGLRWSRQ
ncbi:MAG: TonB-dependent receptor plug domain-containing protein [Longimicrobiales bacterium]